MQLRDAGETRAFGRRIGALAVPGSAIGLTGALGAGKTTLVRGIAEGLGVPARVTSPTFVLVAVHDGGRLTLWHADLYRVDSAADIDLLALDDAREGVLAVEWADRFPDVLPDDHLAIHLEDDGAGRRVEMIATGPIHAPLAEALRG
jgi:tRNA threonylcarbamoyladenosine biosynthesis protein TsaE